MKEHVERLCRSGAVGNIDHFAAWLEMQNELCDKKVPEKFADFSQTFNIDSTFIKNNPLPRKIDKQELKEAINELLNEGVLTNANQYEEYSLSDVNGLEFPDNQMIFLTGSRLDQEPIQFMRSILLTYCKKNGIPQEIVDELGIAITEAAENAVKYSDQSPIISQYQYVDGIIEIRIINSVPEFNLEKEIEQGKFSHDISLMRGVLVMSRLLDSIDIQEDEGLARVELVGRKKIA